MINDAVIPWLICGAFILTFVFVGLFAGRNVDRTADEFLTGGRGVGPIVIALSIFATGNTGFMFVGAVGAGYAQGIAAIWIPFAWFLGEAVYWEIFPKRINEETARRRHPVSVPDYISRVAPPVDRRRVHIAAGLVILISTLPYIVGQNIAAGKAFSSVVDVSSRLGVVIAGGFVTSMALIYCARGGLRSSMIANTMQGGAITILGVIMLFTVGSHLLAAGDPVALITAANPDAFNPFAIHPATFIAVVVLGAAVASFGSAMSLPTMLMRIGAASSPKALAQAKWGYLAITYLFWAVMSFIGVMLSGALPNVADPEQALFLFADSQSPYLLGLTLAGVSALILSTIDGSVMVGGSAISDDVGNAGAKPPAQRRAMRVFGLLAFGGGALFIAILLADSSVYDIILFGVSALAGGIGPAFMISTLKMKTNANALASTIVLGMVVAMTWAALGLSDVVAEALPSFVVGLSWHWLVTRGASKEVVDASVYQE